MSSRMQARLVCDALRMAIWWRQPPAGVGDAYDNAMAESFFASLKCELIDRCSWKNKTEARLAIFT
ncbi:MAG: IS3 family transposase, partial [Nitrosomonas sp.]